MIAGHATPEGTARFAARVAGRVGPGHFRPLGPWTAGSIGLGTYLGEPDDPTDRAVADATVRTLEAGCNVLDSAINYRHMRGERAVGRGLARAIADGLVQRDEVIVCTKGGFISFDGNPPPDPGRYFADEYVQPGVVAPADVVAGCHCMTPGYLTNQIGRSLANLALETIDVYYVHNPETQLAAVSRADVMARLHSAFEALEQEVTRGRIQVYGTATWSAYRDTPDGQSYLSLAELVRLAEDVAGSDHHFRVVQMPYNLAMPEAHAKFNQRVGDRAVAPLACAQSYGIGVCVSAPLMQAQLCRPLPPLLGEVFPGAATPAQQAIQFVRSTPGVSTALVGMKTPEHCADSLGTVSLPPEPAGLARLFTKP